MNKVSLTLAKLSSQLVAMEGIIKKPNALMTKMSFARPKPEMQEEIGPQESKGG